MVTWLERAVTWLRSGYPHGLTHQHYVPLVALLRRRLTDEEIADLGNELVRRGIVPADKIDVAVGVLKRTNELPSEDEMRRIRMRLYDGGWPVEFDGTG